MTLIDIAKHVTPDYKEVLEKLAVISKDGRKSDKILKGDGFTRGRA